MFITCLLVCLLPSRSALRTISSIWRSSSSKIYGGGSSAELGDNNRDMGSLTPTVSGSSMPIIHTSIAEILRNQRKKEAKTVVGFKDVDEAFVGENTYAASIQAGGYFSSYEYFCCQPETQSLVSRLVPSLIMEQQYHFLLPFLSNQSIHVIL